MLETLQTLFDDMLFGAGVGAIGCLIYWRATVISTVKKFIKGE